MSVTAPPLDKPGTLIDAQIAQVQQLVNANKNPLVLYQLQQELNALQVQAVNHYMVTGWLNAGTILQTYTPPSWDVPGQAILARVASLTATYNKAVATPMPPGNVDGYGGSGWTSLAAQYLQTLYAKQMELVQHLMDLPGGTSAATMLANLTGFQTDPGGVPYAYFFQSVGFTDQDIEGGN